jgi:hypothetical protein
MRLPTNGRGGEAGFRFQGSGIRDQEFASYQLPGVSGQTVISCQLPVVSVK